ncbi:hypothetical protein ABGB12_26535 [Actinocorallia sp. B10E7]|uniref:hypothetical protein n=1 Tax=Actinocorallia sp. B10E7 TaxID=3153558 RepID=UPI00325CDC7B
MIEHGVRVAVAAVVLGASVIPAKALAAPGKPLKPVWTTRLPASSDFMAIVAPDKKNVWAFGGNNANSPRDRPLVYRKSGAEWKPVELPRGLGGYILKASASSADNVWAMGEDPHSPRSTTFLLRWDGKRWRVAKRWERQQHASIVATGKRGVWVFDEERARALRFDGRRWRQVKTPVAVVGAAAQGEKLWAWGHDKDYRSKIVRFDGRRWKTAHPGSLLPEPAKQSITYFDRPVISGKNVWVTGVHIHDFQDDTQSREPLLLRYKNGKWRKEKIAPSAGIARDPRSDGRGGLVFLTYKNVPGRGNDLVHDLFLTRLTAEGRWSQRRQGRIVNERPWISDYARLPGTLRLLVVGYVERKNGSDAAVFSLS